MKLSLRSRWMVVGSLAIAIAVGFAAFTGMSSGAPADNPSGVVNTAGSGGYPYEPALAKPAKAASELSTPMQAELGSIGARYAVPLASVGSGDDVTSVYSLVGADGAHCIEFTHGSGAAAEPPNCASDAELRVSSIENGTGNPDAGTVISKQVVAVVATNVATVQVTFSDGSSHSYVSSGDGVVTVQTSSDQAMPTSVSALDANGTTLAALNV